MPYYPPSAESDLATLPSPVRTAERCSLFADLPDGYIVSIAGYDYKVDSTKTGSDSATNDIGVDGLVPFGDLYPEHFGATGGADDSAALQRMFDYWLALLEVSSLKPAKIIINKKYSFSTALDVVFSATNFVGGVIDMSGGQLVSSVASGTAVRFAARAVVRNIRFIKLNIRGSNTEDILLDIDGGDADASPAQFLYGCQFEKPILENFSKIGLWLHNNVFETTISDNYFSCTSTAAGSYSMLCQDDTDGATSGNVSSIVLTGGVMRGGIHNLYCDDNADIRCYGTTFLLSGKELVVEDNMIGGAYIGIHLENAWEDGASGTSTVQAGIKVQNSANLSNIYATANNGKMNTAINAFFVQDDCDIRNVIVTSDVTKAVYLGCPNTTTPRMTLSGVSRSKVDFANARTKNFTSFPARQNVEEIDGDGTSTLAIDVNKYNVFEVSLTANTIIASPTGMNTGDEITLTFIQDATGGHTVTFPADIPFSSSGLTLKTSADEVTTFKMYWNGSIWRLYS